MAWWWLCRSDTHTRSAGFAAMPEAALGGTRVRLLPPKAGQPSLEATVSVSADGVTLRRTSSGGVICSLPFSTVKGFTDAAGGGVLVLKAVRNGQLGEIKLEGSGGDPVASLASLRSQLGKYTSPYAKRPGPSPSSAAASSSSTASAPATAQRSAVSSTKAAAERAAQLRAKIAAQQQQGVGRDAGTAEADSPPPAATPARRASQARRKASIESLEELTALADQVATESSRTPSPEQSSKAGGPIAPGSRARQPPSLPATRPGRGYEGNETC